MSEAATPQPPAEAKPAAPEKPAAAAAAPARPAAAGPALPVLIGAAVGALVVGAALGALLVGPMVVRARAAAATTAAAQKAESARKGEAKSALFKLDNIIVNPAGTQGTRFLMATVAFEVRDEKTVDLLKEREVQIRDRVLGVLESRSLEELTVPGARDSLRGEIHDAVAPVAKDVPAFEVYLPNFVIQ